MVNEDSTYSNESGENPVVVKNEDMSTSPAVRVTELSKKGIGNCYESSKHSLKEPLIEKSDDMQKASRVTESKEKLATPQAKTSKTTNVTFSSGDLYRQDPFVSPSASRITLGFGSLDIIMENDKSRQRECVSPENDRYDRPQKWGWAVVIASWIVLIPVVGVLSSFGTIVSALTEEFNATKLEAGWIGSLAFSFTVGTCPFSNALYTVFGARKVALVGVLGASVSVVVTSFAPVLYLFFLTYSAMLGVFANFIYNSAMNLTGQYFPFKHQALATCLASAGVSFGTLLINPLSRNLVENIGWRHTLRILSAGIFVIGLGCVAVFRPVKTKEQKIITKVRRRKGKRKYMNEPLEDALAHAKINSLDKVDIEALTESIQQLPNESRISLAAQEIKKSVFNKKAFDCSICNNPAFILWMLGTLLWSVSFLFPFIFLIDYMSTIGIHGHISSWVMTAYGIAEFVGRLACAVAAGKVRFSLAYLYSGSALFVGLATILAPFGRTLETMFVYSVCAGLSSGVLNSLMFVATMQFFGNIQGKHVWGYINVMLALGMVVGPVAAGGIFDATHSYEAAFYMGGSVFILCAVVMAFIPCAIKKFPNSELTVSSNRENSSKVESKDNQKRSIVKQGALRKLALSQSALRGRVVNKSKWNGEVETHLRELHEIEEEIMSEKANLNGKHVT